MGRPRKSVEVFLPRVRSGNTEMFCEMGKTMKFCQDCWVFQGVSQMFGPPNAWFSGCFPRQYIPSWNSWKYHKGGRKFLGSVRLLSRNCGLSICRYSMLQPSWVSSPQVKSLKLWDLKAEVKELRNSQRAKKKGNPGRFAPSLAASSGREAAKAVTFPQGLEIIKRSASFLDWP